MGYPRIAAVAPNRVHVVGSQRHKSQDHDATPCTGCHHDDMDLDVVRGLQMADQLTYLRGRILEAALSMEAVVRYLHVRLSGGSDLEEALHTPKQFQVLIAECAEHAARCARFSDRTRSLAMDAIHQAARLYERRNRFVHDALRLSLVSEQRWERSKLWRPKREIGEPLPEPEPVSADEMVELVFDLIRTTWRLRGALWCLVGSSQEASPYLTHPFEPQWDGSFLAVRGASGESTSSAGQRR